MATNVDDRDVDLVLAEADRRAASSGAAAAVRFLTEQNRRQRDRRIERLLLDLRIAAMAEFDAAEDVQWPSAGPDMFSGERIPEITAAGLTTEALRNAIAHHGMLIVRGLLDEKQSGLLREDIERAFAAFDARERGSEPSPELSGWFEPCSPRVKGDRRGKRERGAVLAVDSPPAVFDLINVLDEVGLRRLLSEYFGETPAMLARKVTLRRVAATAGTGGWHQDGAFMGQNIRSLNVWIPLTRCGKEAPGMDVVARRLEQLVATGDGAFAAWGVTDETAEAVAAGAIVRPLFDPGDAFIFDHLCLHRTAVDPGMVRDRHAIEAWFLSPSTYGAMLETVDDGFQPQDQVPFLY